ncbi:MAG: AbgT family transporter [Bacteroidales bacterium]|nr:AbgT family transporter [Bacteroidales bacterium]
MNEKRKRSFSDKVLHGIEVAGNALPHPAALFGLFGLVTILFSYIGFLLDWQGVNPANGETVRIINLLSKEGLHRIILGMVDNYTGFAPLGIVMVAMLGLGVAESSGLVKAGINELC